MIRVVFLDIDGVLTDGAVYVDGSGNETKRILFDDIDAIFELKRAGIKIGFITGENTKFCQYVRERFDPDFFVAGCKDKLSACKKILAEAGLEKSDVCYAGDSKKDVALLKYLPLSFAPADVNPFIQASAKVVLKTRRGQGIVSELAEIVLAQAY